MNRKWAKALGLHPARNRKDWVEKINYWEERLAPLLPNVDRHDLGLILHEVFRPLSVPRKLFYRPLPRIRDVS